MSSESCIAAALGVSRSREIDIERLLIAQAHRGYVAPYILSATGMMDPDERVLLAYMLGRMVTEGKIKPL
jgi:hypothetical protein